MEPQVAKTYSTNISQEEAQGMIKDNEDTLKKLSELQKQLEETRKVKKHE